MSFEDILNAFDVLRATPTENQHIGVIAPYRQQCAKIRKLLQKAGHGGVDVKVTEDWQGQVNTCALVCTIM